MFSQEKLLTIDFPWGLMVGATGIEPVTPPV
jgi:hypothetical protein